MSAVIVLQQMLVLFSMIAIGVFFIEEKLDRCERTESSF